APPAALVSPARESGTRSAVAASFPRREVGRRRVVGPPEAGRREAHGPARMASRLPPSPREPQQGPAEGASIVRLPPPVIHDGQHGSRVTSGTARARVPAGAGRGRGTSGGAGPAGGARAVAARGGGGRRPGAAA